MIYLTLAYIFSLLLIILTPLPFIPTLLLLISALFLLLFFAYRSKINWINVSLIMCGCLLGIFSANNALVGYNRAIITLPLQDRFVIEVLNSHPDRHSIEAKIIESPQERKSKTLNGYRLYLYDLDKKIHPFKRGERYRLSMRLNPLNSPQFPTEMNKRLHYLSNGLIANGSRADNIELIQSPNWINQIRQSIYDRFHQSNFKYRGYLSALTVGITDDLTQEDWEVLRQTGTIHLVSISGLHISFIALWGFILFRSLFGFMMIKRIPPYRLAAFVAINIAFFYALIAGLGLPTQRAFIMFTIAMLALIFYRPMLTLYSLATAAFIILLLSPLSILSIGFWLSFSAVALLIILNRYRFAPWKLLLITQCSVSFIVIPFTASFFGEISLISPLANLFAIPWLTLTILPPLLISIIINPLSSTIADLLLYVSNYSLAFMMTLLRWLNNIPYSSITTPNIPFITALFTTLTLLVLLAKKRRKVIISLLSLTLFSSLLMFHKKPTQALYLMPVSEGLSLFIDTPDQTILFDTGLYFRRYDAGRRVIIPTLESLNINTLDLLILSKDNQQHIGGTQSVRRRYPNADVVTQAPLLDYIERADDCHHYQYRDRWITLHPLTEIKSSCAFIATIGDHTLWVIADITANEWQTIIERYPLPDLLLFPNQGRSRYFTIEPLIGHDTTILFSTKSIHPDLQPLLEQNDFYNAYYGIVQLSLDNSISVQQYHDEGRYWWMSENRN